MLEDAGLRLSRVGFGAMHFEAIDDEAEVGRLLNGVLDAGVTLIDTARGYGRSEERIGRHLAHRRREFVLSTKLGYGVDGVPDWTYDCIVLGVQRALRLLRCDVIDIGHLHSCPLHVLQRGEVTAALHDCVRAGTLRVAAYAGDGAELALALADPRFGAVQCSLSLADRNNRAALAGCQGQRVLVKRSLAGRAWALAQRPDGFCEAQLWDRWRALDLPDPGMPWTELALRFAAHQPAVSSVLLGTSRLQHLHSAIDAVARGPLPAALLAEIDRAWARCSGEDWPALI